MSFSRAVFTIGDPVKTTKPGIHTSVNRFSSICSWQETVYNNCLKGISPANNCHQRQSYYSISHAESAACGGLQTHCVDGSKMPWPRQELTLQFLSRTPFAEHLFSLLCGASYRLSASWNLQGGIVHPLSPSTIRNPSIWKTWVTTFWRLTADKPARSVQHHVC